MEAKLKVINGAKGAVIRLKLPTTIGRGSESSLKVPQSEVSRSHCEIYEEDGLLAVNDLGSSNGTFVNDEQIDGPTFLYPGDILKVGTVALEAIYKADASLVPDVVADQDADTGVTAADVKAVTAKAKEEPVEKAPAKKEPAKKVAKAKPVVAKEVVKEEPVVAEEVAPVEEEAEASGLDLDEVLGDGAADSGVSVDMFEEVAEEPTPEPVAKPKPTAKPAAKPAAPVAKKPAPKPAKKVAAAGAAAAGVVAATAAAVAKKPSAKKPAANPPAKKVAAKKPAAPDAKKEDPAGSSVSAIVDYEENDGGSFIAIQAIATGDETPGAEVSSFALDVGETGAPSAISGFSLDTGDEQPSAIEVAEFSVGDEEESEGGEVDGGDSALNDFFKNLE